jgi:hypothetical protein
MNGYMVLVAPSAARFTASLGLLRNHTCIGGPRYQKQTFGQLAANGG